MHLDLPPELLPDDYVLVTIDLDALATEALETEALDTLAPDPLAFGDTWLRDRRTPVLQVPSAIVPECGNLLLNPAHPEAGAASVVGRRRFAFDRRLWRAG